MTTFSGFLRVFVRQNLPDGKLVEEAWGFPFRVGSHTRYLQPDQFGTEQSEDPMLAHATRIALFELMTRIFPEEAAAHYFSEDGHAAIELATGILSSSADDTARETATKLLEVVMSKLPPKGRA